MFWKALRQTAIIVIILNICHEFYKYYDKEEAIKNEASLSKSFKSAHCECAQHHT